jgi:hypothetical protein
MLLLGGQLREEAALPRSQAERHGLVGPLNAETVVVRDPAAKHLPSAVHCTCPGSPWCDGPTGAYWLTCNRSCCSCHPPRRRRQTANTPEGDDGV